MGVKLYKIYQYLGWQALAQASDDWDYECPSNTGVDCLCTLGKYSSDPACFTWGQSDWALWGKYIFILFLDQFACYTCKHGYVMNMNQEWVNWVDNPVDYELDWATCNFDENSEGNTEVSYI